jgi:hypothetical protein
MILSCNDVHRAARGRQQARMQGALGRAGLGHRRQLRPRQQMAQEIVGHHPVALGGPIEQVRAAGRPVIAHQPRT